MVTYQIKKMLTWSELVRRFYFAFCNESCDEIFISILSNAKTELCLVCGQRLFTPLDQYKSNIFEEALLGKFVKLKKKLLLTLILPRSRTGTVCFYTSTSNKRAARPKLYTKSLTRDLKLMYSRFTLVRISIKL